MTFTRAWDETIPAGTEVRSLGDDRIRNMKADIRERMTLEHLGGLLTTSPAWMNIYKIKELVVGDSPYTVLLTETLYICDTDGGDIHLDLPAISGNDGKPYIIAVSGTNSVELDGNAAETVGGYATYIIDGASRAKVMLVCDETLGGWRLVDLGLTQGFWTSPHPYLNLVIQSDATHHVHKLGITADSIVLVGTQYDRIILGTWNGVADIEEAGANGLDTGVEAADTWYYIWAISDGHSRAFLLSVSPTNPTLPATYTYKAFLGAIRNDSGSDFQSIYQRDNKVALGSVGYIVDAQNHIESTTVDLGNVAGTKGLSPSTAKKVNLYFYLNYVSAAGHLIVDTFQNTISFGGQHLGYVNSSVGASFGFFSVIPSSSNTIRYCVTAAGLTVSFLITGWEF